MTYNVLVKRINGQFTATVLGIPNFTVEASTRTEAVDRARAAMADLLSGGELIQIDLPILAHPVLTNFVGMWSDDETFDDFTIAMKSYRHEAESLSH